MRNEMNPAQGEEKGNPAQSEEGGQGMNGEWMRILEEMIRCGEGLIRAAEELKKMPACKCRESAADAEPEPREEKEEKTYTFAEVRKAFSAKAHEGYTKQIRELIGKYGADKLSGIAPENYPALMARLEEIG